VIAVLDPVGFTDQHRNPLSSRWSWFAGRRTGQQIAAELRLSPATVSRILRLCLNRIAALELFESRCIFSLGRTLA